jgi:hypothetical protein
MVPEITRVRVKSAASSELHSVVETEVWAFDQRRSSPLYRPFGEASTAEDASGLRPVGFSEEARPLSSLLFPEPVTISHHLRAGLTGMPAAAVPPTTRTMSPKSEYDSAERSPRQATGAQRLPVASESGLRR